MTLLENKNFRLLIKVVAWVTVFTFTFEQVVFADGGNIFSRKYQEKRTGQSSVIASAVSEANEAKQSPIKKAEIASGASRPRNDAQKLITHPSGISIPADAGTIEGVYYTQSAILNPQNKPLKNLVIHIQDAHANYGAQKNEAKLIEHLLRYNNINKVLVEGGWGDVSLNDLRKLASLDIRKKVADEYLKQARMHGEEVLNLVSDINFKLYGIEDKALYEENLRAFLDSSESAESLKENVEKLKIKTDALKQKLFSPELLELDHVIAMSKATKQSPEIASLTSFARNDAPMDTSAYLAYLKNLAIKTNLPKQEYESVANFVNADQLSKTLDIQKINKERIKAIEDISKRLTNLKMKDFMNLSLRLKDGKIRQSEYYAAMRNIARENGINFELQYKNLNAYIDYLQVSDNINSSEIFKSADKLEIRLLGALAKSNKEKTLVDLCQHLIILEKLFNLQMVPNEYSLYLDIKKTLTKSEIENAFYQLDKSDIVKNVKLPDNFDRLTGSFEKFYQSAAKRDEVFVNNISAAINETKGPVIMVAGGFHTAHLKEMFKDRGFTYAVIAPKIDELSDRQLYYNSLKGILSPLEKIFAAGGIKANNLRSTALVHRAGAIGALTAVLEAQAKGTWTSETGLAEALASGKLEKTTIAVTPKPAVVTPKPVTMPASAAVVKPAAVTRVTKSAEAAAKGARTRNKQVAAKKRTEFLQRQARQTQQQAAEQKKQSLARFGPTPEQIRETIVASRTGLSISYMRGMVNQKLLVLAVLGIFFFGGILSFYQALRMNQMRQDKSSSPTTATQTYSPQPAQQVPTSPTRTGGIKNVIPDKYPLVLFQRFYYPQLKGFTPMPGTDIACMTYRNFATGPNGILDVSGQIRNSNVPYWLGIETLTTNLVDVGLTFDANEDTLPQELSNTIDGLETADDMKDLKGIYIHSGRSSRDPNAKRGETDDSRIFNNRRLRQELKRKAASRLGGKYFATFAWSPKQQILSDRNYFRKRAEAGVNCVFIDGDSFLQMNADERNAIFAQAKDAGIKTLAFIGGKPAWLNNNAAAMQYYRDLTSKLDATDTRGIKVLIADDTEIEPEAKNLSAYNKLIAGSGAVNVAPGQMPLTQELGQRMSKSISEPEAYVVNIGDTGGNNTVIIDTENSEITESRQPILVPPRFFNQQPPVRLTLDEFKKQIDAIVNGIKILGRHPVGNLQGEPKWQDRLSPVEGRPTVATLWERIEKEDMNSLVRWCKLKGITEIEYESRHMAYKEESIAEVFAFIKYAKENGIDVVLIFSGTEAILQPEIGLRYMDLIQWTNINNVLDGEVRFAFDIEPTQLPGWDKASAQERKDIMFAYALFIKRARLQTGAHITVYIDPSYVKAGFGEALDYHKIDDEVDIVYMAYGRTSDEILGLLNGNILTIKDDKGNVVKIRDFYIGVDIGQQGWRKNFYFGRSKMMPVVREVDKQLKEKYGERYKGVNYNWGKNRDLYKQLLKGGPGFFERLWDDFIVSPLQLIFSWLKLCFNYAVGTMIPKQRIAILSQYYVGGCLGWGIPQSMVESVTKSIDRGDIWINKNFIPAPPEIGFQYQILNRLWGDSVSDGWNEERGWVGTKIVDYPIGFLGSIVYGIVKLIDNIDGKIDFKILDPWQWQPFSRLHDSILTKIGDWLPNPVIRVITFGLCTKLGPDGKAIPKKTELTDLSVQCLDENGRVVLWPDGTDKKYIYSDSKYQQDSTIILPENAVKYRITVEGVSGGNWWQFRGFKGYLWFIRNPLLPGTPWSGREIEGPKIGGNGFRGVRLGEKFKESYLIEQNPKDPRLILLEGDSNFKIRLVNKNGQIVDRIGPDLSFQEVVAQYNKNAFARFEKNNKNSQVIFKSDAEIRSLINDTDKTKVSKLGSTKVQKSVEIEYSPEMLEEISGMINDDTFAVHDIKTIFVRADMNEFIKIFRQQLGGKDPESFDEAKKPELLKAIIKSRMAKDMRRLSKEAEERGIRVEFVIPDCDSVLQAELLRSGVPAEEVYKTFYRAFIGVIEDGCFMVKGYALDIGSFQQDPSQKVDAISKIIGHKFRYLEAKNNYTDRVGDEEESGHYLKLLPEDSKVIYDLAGNKVIYGGFSISFGKDIKNMRKFFKGIPGTNDKALIDLFRSITAGELATLQEKDILHMSARERLIYEKLISKAKMVTFEIGRNVADMRLATDIDTREFESIQKEIADMQRYLDRRTDLNRKQKDKLRASIAAKEAEKAIITRRGLLLYPSQITPRIAREGQDLKIGILINSHSTRLLTKQNIFVRLTNLDTGEEIEIRPPLQLTFARRENERDIDKPILQTIVLRGLKTGNWRYGITIEPIETRDTNRLNKYIAYIGKDFNVRTMSFEEKQFLKPTAPCIVEVGGIKIKFAENGNSDIAVYTDPDPNDKQLDVDKSGGYSFAVYRLSPEGPSSEKTVKINGTNVTLKRNPSGDIDIIAKGESATIHSITTRINGALIIKPAGTAVAAVPAIDQQSEIQSPVQQAEPEPYTEIPETQKPFMPLLLAIWGLIALFSTWVFSAFVRHLNKRHTEIRENQKLAEIENNRPTLADAKGLTVKSPRENYASRIRPGTGDRYYSPVGDIRRFRFALNILEKLGINFISVNENVRKKQHIINSKKIDEAKGSFISRPFKFIAYALKVLALLPILVLISIPWIFMHWKIYRMITKEASKSNQENIRAKSERAVNWAQEAIEGANEELALISGGSFTAVNQLPGYENQKKFLDYYIHKKIQTESDLLLLIDGADTKIVGNVHGALGELRRQKDKHALLPAIYTLALFDGIKGVFNEAVYGKDIETGKKNLTGFKRALKISFVLSMPFLLVIFPAPLIGMLAIVLISKLLGRKTHPLISYPFTLLSGLILMITIPLQFFVSMKMRIFESQLPNANVLYKLSDFRKEFYCPTDADAGIADHLARLGRWMQAHLSIITPELVGSGITAEDRSGNYEYSLSDPAVRTWADCILNNLGDTDIEKQMAANRLLYLLSDKNPYDLSEPPEITYILHQRYIDWPYDSSSTPYHIQGEVGAPGFDKLKKPEGVIHTHGGIKFLWKREFNCGPVNIVIEEYQDPSSRLPKARVSIDGSPFEEISEEDKTEEINGQEFIFGVNSARNITITHNDQTIILCNNEQGKLVVYTEAKAGGGDATSMKAKEFLNPDNRYEGFNASVPGDAKIIMVGQGETIDFGGMDWELEGNNYEGFAPSDVPERIFVRMPDKSKTGKMQTIFHWFAGIPREEAVVDTAGDVTVDIQDLRNNLSPDIRIAREQVARDTPNLRRQGREILITLAPEEPLAIRYQIEGERGFEQEEQSVLPRLGQRPVDARTRTGFARLLAREFSDYWREGKLNWFNVPHMFLQSLRLLVHLLGICIMYPLLKSAFKIDTSYLHAEGAWNIFKARTINKIIGMNVVYYIWPLADTIVQAIYAEVNPDKIRFEIEQSQMTDKMRIARFGGKALISDLDAGGIKEADIRALITLFVNRLNSSELSVIIDELNSLMASLGLPTLVSANKNDIIDFLIGIPDVLTQVNINELNAERGGPLTTIRGLRDEMAYSLYMAKVELAEGAAANRNIEGLSRLLDFLSAITGQIYRTRPITGLNEDGINQERLYLERDLLRLGHYKYLEFRYTPQPELLQPASSNLATAVDMLDHGPAEIGPRTDRNVRLGMPQDDMSVLTAADTELDGQGKDWRTWDWADLHAAGRGGLRIENEDAFRRYLLDPNGALSNTDTTDYILARTPLEQPSDDIDEDLSKCGSVMLKYLYGIGVTARTQSDIADTYAEQRNVRNKARYDEQGIPADFRITVKPEDIAALSELSSEARRTGKIQPGSRDADIICKIFGAHPEQLASLVDSSDYPFVLGPAPVPGKLRLSWTLWTKRGTERFARPVNFPYLLYVLNEPAWTSAISAFNFLPTDFFDTDIQHGDDTLVARLFSMKPEWNPATPAIAVWKILSVLGKLEGTLDDKALQRAMKLFKGLGMRYASQTWMDDPLWDEFKQSSDKNSTMIDGLQELFERPLWYMKALKHDVLSATGRRGAGFTSSIFFRFTANNLINRNELPVAPGVASAVRETDEFLAIPGAESTVESIAEGAKRDLGSPLNVDVNRGLVPFILDPADVYAAAKTNAPATGQIHTAQAAGEDIANIVLALAGKIQLGNQHPDLVSTLDKIGQKFAKAPPRWDEENLLLETAKILAEEISTLHDEIFTEYGTVNPEIIETARDIIGTHIEYVDELNPDGTDTGRVIDRKIATESGVPNRGTAVLIFSHDGKKVLLQLRSPEKSVFPSRWTVSVAGGTKAGQPQIDSAVRETQEEFTRIAGIDINQDRLNLIRTNDGYKGYVKVYKINNKIYYITKEGGEIYCQDRVSDEELQIVREAIERGDYEDKEHRKTFNLGVWTLYTCTLTEEEEKEAAKNIAESQGNEEVTKLEFIDFNTILEQYRTNPERYTDTFEAYFGTPGSEEAIRQSVANQVSLANEFAALTPERIDAAQAIVKDIIRMAIFKDERSVLVRVLRDMAIVYDSDLRYKDAVLWLTFVKEKTLNNIIAEQQSARSPPQANLIVMFAGPGSGKSTLTNSLLNLVPLKWLPVRATREARLQDDDHVQSPFYDYNMTDEQFDSIPNDDPDYIKTPKDRIPGTPHEGLKGYIVDKKWARELLGKGYNLIIHSWVWEEFLERSGAFDNTLKIFIYVEMPQASSRLAWRNLMSARKNGLLNQQAIAQIPRNPNETDVAWALEILEKLEDKTLFKDLQQRLASVKKGYIIVSQPGNIDNFKVIVDNTGSLKNAIADVEATVVSERYLRLPSDQQKFPKFFQRFVDRAIEIEAQTMFERLGLGVAKGTGIDGKEYENVKADQANRQDSNARIGILAQEIHERTKNRGYVSDNDAVSEVQWLLERLIARTNCSDMMFRLNMPAHMREIPDMVKRLNPSASSELLIAGMLHDADRFFDGFYVSIKDEPPFDSPLYKNYYKPIQHPRMAADFARPLLELLKIDEKTIQKAVLLIKNHELGITEDRIDKTLPFTEEERRQLTEDSAILKDADAISSFTPVLFVNSHKALIAEGRAGDSYNEVWNKYTRVKDESRKVIDDIMGTRVNEYLTDPDGQAAYEVFIRVQQDFAESTADETIQRNDAQQITVEVLAEKHAQLRSYLIETFAAQETDRYALILCPDDIEASLYQGLETDLIDIGFKNRILRAATIKEAQALISKYNIAAIINKLNNISIEDITTLLPGCEYEGNTISTVSDTAKQLNTWL